MLHKRVRSLGRQTWNIFHKLKYKVRTLLPMASETKTLEVLNCVQEQPEPLCAQYAPSCDLDFYLLGWLYTRAEKHEHFECQDGIMISDDTFLVANFGRDEKRGPGRCPTFIFNKLVERLRTLKCAVLPGMVVRVPQECALYQILVDALALKDTNDLTTLNLKASILCNTSFIRGIYDSTGTLYCTTGKVSCRLTLQRQLRAIINVVVPAIHTECNDHYVQYEDTNALDFLGQVYRGCSENGELLRNTVKFNRYIYAMKCCAHEFDRLPTVKFRMVDEKAVRPEQFRVSDVGFDLSIISKVRDLGPAMALYDTGIQVTPPHGFYMEVIPRSSISKSGYMMLNSVGIIDPAYTGSILVALIKVDPTKPDIAFPTRCAQLVMRRLYHFELSQVDNLAKTQRADGGFGSTGMQTQ